MKKLLYAFCGLAALMSVFACNDTETYAEKRDKELKAIGQFLVDSAITVISEQQFFAQDSTTNVAKNEYVLINSEGVYMQIVRKGFGNKLRNGETATVLCRFSEKNILTDSLILANNVLSFTSIVDKMSVTNNSGSFTGTFDTNSSIMYQAYGYASVPTGWLVPLSYIKLGRGPASEEEEIAYVKLIVPHSAGQYYANSYVYPCFYNITYQRGR